MALLLKKDVIRETFNVTDIKGNKIIVTLKTGDMLEFRTKGKKTRYDVPLAACFNLAMIFTVHEKYNERLKKYEENKKLGGRMKRPKRPPKIFNEKLYQALKLI